MLLILYEIVHTCTRAYTNEINKEEEKNVNFINYSFSLCNSRVQVIHFFGQFLSHPNVTYLYVSYKEI